LAGTNALAYYEAVLVIKEKSFIMLTTGTRTGTNFTTKSRKEMDTNNYAEKQQMTGISTFCIFTARKKGKERNLKH